MRFLFSPLRYVTTYVVMFFFPLSVVNMISHIEATLKCVLKGKTRNEALQHSHKWHVYALAYALNILCSSDVPLIHTIPSLLSLSPALYYSKFFFGLFCIHVSSTVQWPGKVPLHIFWNVFLALLWFVLGNFSRENLEVKFQVFFCCVFQSFINDECLGQQRTMMIICV